MKQQIVILGNGISGVTAARHIRKRSDDNITLVSKETDHFFSRTALMYIYMGHMSYQNTKPYEDRFWSQNNIDLVKDQVESVDFNAKTLILASGEKLGYDKLILAVGSKPNKFGWPGQDLEGVTGMYSYQDLEAIETFTKNIERGVVVGGGLIGIELAEMLHSRNIPVTFLVRESSFWNGVLPPNESDMINRHIREMHIDLQLSTELKEIIPDESGRVKAVRTSQEEVIPCQFVGLTAGVSPNVAFLKDTNLEIERGIMVDPYMKTNIPDVYAIGDCAQHREPPPGRRPVEQVWYTGRMMGEVVAANVTGLKVAYNPGPWFNSAKFFDIEYQTYGVVPAKLNEGQASFYWEHQDGKKCVHFIFKKETHEFLGINNFGIRLRHELFDQWLEEKRDIQFVLTHLSEANFDPEFYTRHEEDIIAAFNTQYPDLAVSLATKKNLFQKIFA
jgi:NAD(P)H-nitrite reductase large subunit